MPRPIWLLDEPTSTLDAAAQNRLAELMQAHLAGGGLILAASHGSIGLSRGAGTAAGGSAMTPLAALLVRDMRIAFGSAAAR